MTTSTGVRTADFASVVTQLREGASVLASMTAAGAWSQLPTVVMADLTADLFRVRDLLGSVANEGVGAVHSSGALPGGHVSTTRWLEVATGMSPSSAGAQLARSRSLREGFVRTRMAWLAGLISDDMVRTITTGIPAALRRLGVADRPALVAGIEEELVPFAVESSITDVRRKLARLRIALDPDGTDARTLEAYDEQQLTLTPVGDGYELRGYLTKESAAVLLTCLDQTVDGWFRDGSLTPEQRELTGDDVMARGRKRTRRPHLNALALTELCERLLDAGGLGTRHAQRPHVMVTVDAQEYRAGLGGLLHLPGMESEPITAATVDRILCDADLTTILARSAVPSAGEQPDAWLHDAAREVLYVGRAQRTAHPRLRKALAIRDQHCRFPHCRVAADRCHAHHVRHWEHGGSTDPANMVLLCHAHHHLVHEGGWSITRTPGARDGQPKGWDIGPPPRRP